MNNKEKLETWKRKLIEIENKIQKVNNEKDILVNLYKEVKTKQNFKLNNSLRGLNLVEEILHLNDWIEFHGKEISNYKNKINALKTEVSEQEILKKEFEDLDKEPKVVEKELPEEPIDVEIPTPEDLEKDVHKEIIREFDEPELDITGLEDEKEELEKPEFMIAGPQKEDEKELTAITRLFDERPEIKAVRAQIKELFKDKKDIIRQSRFKETLKNRRFLVSWKSQISTKLNTVKGSTVNVFESVKTSVNNRFESLKSFDKKYMIYTIPVILLLLFTGILFISKPEIIGYVTLTQEKTYTDNLDLIVNESGNYTWTINREGDIQSIKASGKVKGNGTVKVYIEKDGIRYLIFNNNKSK